MIKYRSNPAEDEGMFRMDLRLLVKSAKAAHPDSNKVADSFHRHIPLFQKSEICRCLKIKYSSANYSMNARSTRLLHSDLDH